MNRVGGRTRTARVAGATLVMAVLGGATAASAQHSDNHWDDRDDRDRYDVGWKKPSVFIGGGLSFADPVGEFARFVEDGWGVDGNVRVAVDPAGLLSLRMGGGFVQYGYERQRVCVSGCRVVSDLVTTNNIGYLDAGPELGFDVGPIRPYAGVSAGVTYFNTSSSLKDYDPYYDDYDTYETTNFDDLVLAWRARTGMQVLMGGGRTPIYVDFGVVYHENGHAEYLTEGDIQDNADGSITVFPTFSEANLVTFQFGVSVGVGGGRDDHDDYHGGAHRGHRR